MRPPPSRYDRTRNGRRASRLPPRMADDGRERAPGARTAVPRRFDPLRRRPRSPGHPTSGMSAADLMAVLRREPPALRLRRPEERRQRPAGLLEGPRVDAAYAIFRAAGRSPTRSSSRTASSAACSRGTRRRCIPWVDVATGSLGQGLPIGVGMALAGEVPRPAPIPRLGALRRQRDGRGLDVGGVRARVALRARQPDRDHRRQPARPARRDDDRLEHRRLRRAGARVRLERDRDRRPRRRGDRRAPTQRPRRRRDGRR